ncbi:MAG: TlpA disulfide reductase family protein [Pirellulales bacterium]
MSARSWRLSLGVIAGLSFPAFFSGAAVAQTEQLTRALSFKPQQVDVEYDQVPADKIAACTIEQVEREDGTGFLITDGNGQTLRWFVDTNSDKKPDRWCYFSQGSETYREMDVDFDGKAEEYRWLSTGGLRWGVDTDKDSKIDLWKMISAEEATAEVVSAVANRDVKRFAALLLTGQEVTALGVGKDKAEKLEGKTKDAAAAFEKWAAGQSVVTSQSRWTHFGADKPGIVPAGTEGCEKDIVVYENVVALLETAGKPQQLIIGELVQVGPAWRVVDLPRAVSQGSQLEGEAGVFLSSGIGGRAQLPAWNGESGISKGIENLVNSLTEIDDKISKNSGDARLHAQRADILEKLIEASTKADDRTTWIKQFADTVSAGAQTGEYPAGVERLLAMPAKLQAAKATPGDIAYVRFRAIMTENTLENQKPNANFGGILKDFLAKLEAFVNEYPQSDDASEAMNQIGMAAELEGDLKLAESWYKRSAAAFPNLISGRRAKGAVTRLTLAGKSFSVAGKTLDDRKFDSKTYEGGPVIYHYWASWCEPCEAEMRALNELRSKYSKAKVQVVGINVDNNPEEAKAYLKKYGYSWVSVREEGGLDSDLAVGLGIFTLPVSVVTDGKGKVVRTGAHWTELEQIISSLKNK